MPATPIEGLIKNWIGPGTTASTRVSVGSRVQFQLLPAVVIEVTAGEDACFTDALGYEVRRWEATIRGIAETALEAESLVTDAVFNISASIPDPSVAYSTGQRTIEEPVIGEGDEAQPAIASQNIVILHRT